LIEDAMQQRADKSEVPVTVEGRKYFNIGTGIIGSV
jgi:hypothetical protein